MNLRAVRMVDHWLGVPLCALLTLWDRLLGLFSSREIPTPRNFLVIQISEMGSVVLSYTMLRELKQRYPQARLHFLMFSKNRSALDLLGLVEKEDVFGLDHRGLGAFAASALRAIIQMRRRRIDTVLDLELFSRISALFSRLTGARQRVGFDRFKMEGLYRGGFLTRRVPYNPYLHIAKNQMALLDALASPEASAPPVKLDYSELELETPKLTNDRLADRRIEVKLSRLCPALQAESEIVLLNPSGGDLPIRAWPLAHYVELTQRLLKRSGVCVGVIGLEGDRALYRKMAAEIDSQRFFNLAGETADPRELIEVFNRCQVLVTADSGPAHFASLSSIRCIALFGPETPTLYGPLGTNVRCLYAGLACSPCLTAYNHRDTPCDGDNRCLKVVAPGQVEALVLQELKASRPEVSYALR